ncbi:LOW QUALITY PROTEIN: hypothetical protein V2J09_021162 [Rumex salicifolius]
MPPKFSSAIYELFILDVTLWDDFTCLDLSQCTLNKTVLHVAATYLKSETATCLRFFLSLGSKACKWCGKHLKMTLTPTGESEEEEHGNLFFQLVLELLDFSVACFSTVSRSSLLEDDKLSDTFESYMLEKLNLVKELITEMQRTLFASELLKASQSVLDAAIKLCRVSALAVNWDACNDKDQNTEFSKILHVTNITKYTIETLCDLGVFAANSGGSLVAILNLSWKGVVSLLQLGKGTLAGKVNVAGIISSLISLVNQSFKLAAESWCSLEEITSVSEAKRAFLPDKWMEHKGFKFWIGSLVVKIPTPCGKGTASALRWQPLFSSEHVVDQVYSMVTGNERPDLSMLMLAALLVEGFQISSLSSNLKKIASERIIRDYLHFVEKVSENSMTSCFSDVFGIEVFILSGALQSLQVEASKIGAQTLKFVVFVIQSYRQSTNSSIRMHYCRLLSNALHIVSYAKHLYGSGEVEEVIFELQKTFINEPAAMDAELHKCKSGLTFFMSGLASMKMAESDGNAKSMAIWDLYRMLLKERHWALVHLSTSSFSNFAARTTCNQLWRFVPQNAALAFDPESGTDAKEERFMTELKVFIEKETALITAKASSEQIRLAINEARALEKVLQKNRKASLRLELENAGEFLPNKRRKLPDGVSQGMELLESGLKLVRDGFSKWKQQNHEIHFEDISAHFVSLEAAISHLAGLAKRDEITQFHTAIIKSPPGWSLNQKQTMLEYYKAGKMRAVPERLLSSMNLQQS